jgi:hypothetical protein
MSGSAADREVYKFHRYVVSLIPGRTWSSGPDQDVRGPTVEVTREEIVGRYLARYPSFERYRGRFTAVVTEFAYCVDPNRISVDRATWDRWQPAAEQPW